MAGCAIAQANKIQRAHFFVTVQAPAHILYKRHFGYSHFADITVAGFACHTGRNVRAMIEMNEIGLDRYRDPGDRFVFIYIGLKLQFFSRIRWHLLVTAPAFVG